MVRMIADPVNDGDFFPKRPNANKEKTETAESDNDEADDVYGGEGEVGVMLLGERDITQYPADADRIDDEVRPEDRETGELAWMVTSAGLGPDAAEWLTFGYDDMDQGDVNYFFPRRLVAVIEIPLHLLGAPSLDDEDKNAATAEGERGTQPPVTPIMHTQTVPDAARRVFRVEDDPEQ